MTMLNVVLMDGVSWQGKIERLCTGSPWETTFVSQFTMKQQIRRTHEGILVVVGLRGVEPLQTGRP